LVWDHGPGVNVRESAAGSAADEANPRGASPRSARRKPGMNRPRVAEEVSR
jgi:hypothetical protein